MANITPHATPKGGYPLVLTTFKQGGAKVTVTFPSAAAVNPADPEAEALFKAMRITTAADGYGVAAS